MAQTTGAQQKPDSSPLLILKSVVKCCPLDAGADHRLCPEAPAEGRDSVIPSPGLFFPA